MMHEATLHFNFKASPWRHTFGWYFVNLPVDTSKKIRQELQGSEEGWGRLKAQAQVGKTKWDTAIWFDTKRKTYLLPLKAEVRKKENINSEAPLKVDVWV
ncbi:MAG: hypothetical protein RL660_2577 [Bacteroidota bacterium]|jgi:hypothetical protein